MRVFIAIAFILTSLISCTLNTEKNDRIEKTVTIGGNEFVISVDTFEVKNAGVLIDVKYLNEKYYCLFAESETDMVVLNIEGEIVKSISYPDSINELESTIFVYRDSLFFSSKKYRKTYLINDESLSFEKITFRRIPIFENERYTVYSTCFGEWGGSMFFQDRSTDSIFRLSYTCGVSLNEFNSAYYGLFHCPQSSVNSIIKVDNPKKLDASDLCLDSIYESNITEDFTLFQKYQPLSTMFFNNDSLYCLYYDCFFQIEGETNETHIGKIENRELKNLYTFEFNFVPYFKQQISKQKQVLLFILPDDELRGILIIDHNRFEFHILK